MQEEMKLFDEWFQSNLNRSFSDEAIVSVLRYHVLKAYSMNRIPWKKISKDMKSQYEKLMSENEQ